MTRKQCVELYIDGFRQGSPAKVLAQLTEDVIWRLHGCQTLTGKAAFSAEITNDEFVSIPDLQIHHSMGDGSRVAIVGSGHLPAAQGEARSFTFSEIFLFRDDLICEIDTFHIWKSNGQN